MSIVAVVGFEFPSYSVEENDGALEVCIVVSNPPEGELLFDIITLHVTRDGTAGT